MISKTIDLAGETLHYADFGGQGPTIVLVHGLGGAYSNWLAVGPALARRGRVVALDLPGFGRSKRSRRGTSVDVMGEALARFIDSMSKEPVYLVGNSMGGALAILEAHARPQRIVSTLLVCPALPAAPGAKQEPEWMKTLLVASLPWGHVLLRQHAKKVGPEQGLRDVLALCCVDMSRVPREVLEASIALGVERASMPWNELAFSEATRSLLKLLIVGKRVRRAIRQPGAPTLIVHGQRDRLVDVRCSRAAVAINPGIELIELPDLGHTPQLEAPDAFMEVASRWLDRDVATSPRRPQDAHATDRAVSTA
jgi:pimeloyl-ACP methyl ester carboxylesterase